MTNSPYGTYPTPSSRPPEPPYRADSQERTPGIPNQDGQVPISYGQSAPSGQTQYASSQKPQAAETPLEESTRAHSEPFAGNTAEYTSAGANAYQISDTKVMPRTDCPSAGKVDAAAPSATYSSAQHPASTAQHAAQRTPEPARKSGSAGKTFVFGFLGALVACAVALGGYSLVNNANGSSAGAASGSSAVAVTGSSDSSVINAVEEGQTLAEAVAAKALPSVVAVYNYQEQSSSYGYGFGYGTGTSNSGDLTASGMGSGVVISEDGYILTNYHVVEDADKLTVKVGEDERDATYVGGDSSSDVAVIKIDNLEGVTAADIGNSDDLVIGEWVMTVGAPLGLEQSVATGVVSATNRSTVMSDSSTSSYYGTTDYMYYPNMIQTDAVINPGNSGGALVDADGKLIGINTMISSYSGDYAGVGFAIPINYARGIAEDIIAGKEPTHAILGVSISSVNANNAQRYGLSSSTGAYIASIAEGTGAADSDLQVGDIITAIDGKEINSTTDVTLDVREHQPGDTVTVTVNRGGQTQDVDVVLSSDENLNSSQGGSNNQNNGSGNSNGQRNDGSSGGGSYGYNSEQLEEILRMLGM